MLESTVYSILEVAGTIAFASSGAMVAMKRRLDYLGVVVLGVITAVGGGMFRDMVIGLTPPGMFKDPTNTIIAFWVANCLFITVKMKWSHYLHMETTIYDDVMNLLDALGLGLFTATGVNMAVSAGYGDNSFLCTFLGVITGVGGGILRDILSGQTPAVLRKHIYACASIAGAVSYMALLPLFHSSLAMTFSSCIVVAIRILARKYDWNLPVADSGPDGTFLS